MLLLQTATTAPDSANGLSAIDMLIKGGVIIIPILVLSLISVYIFVEKLIYIYRSSRTDKQFMHKLLLELRQKRTEEALTLCRRNNAMGVVFENGIEMMGKPVRDIESILEASANVEVTKMEKNIAYLGIIAGIAPILGFIGTISGVISIFYNISITDNVSIGIIADGLYQKMISSGTGLLVGIIAYSCYHILQMRIDRFTRRLQEAELSFIKMLMQ